jgi:hypothetical protein
MDCYLFPREAFFAIVLECFLEEFETLQAELNFFGPLPVAFAHTILELFHGLSVKYVHVRQQGKVKAAQRPHIDFVIVPTAEKNLRCHLQRRPTTCLCSLTDFYRTTEPQISDLDHEFLCVNVQIL